MEVKALQIFFIIGVLQVSCEQNNGHKIRIRKCCDTGKILGLTQTCVEGDFHATKLFDVELGNLVHSRRNISMTVDKTKYKCKADDEYTAHVKAVLEDGSLAIKLEDKPVISNNYLCVEAMANVEGIVALMCNATVATRTGVVRRCCPAGEKVDFSKLECVGSKMESSLVQSIPVINRWTGLPTNVYDIQIMDFDRICETGTPEHSPALGITADGFAYSNADQWEYSCVDETESKLIAWTCSGN